MTEETTLRELIDGKIISHGDSYLIVSKEGKQFRIEFNNHNLREIKKQQ